MAGAYLRYILYICTHINILIHNIYIYIHKYIIYIHDIHTHVHKCCNMMIDDDAETCVFKHLFGNWGNKGLNLADASA